MSRIQFDCLASFRHCVKIAAAVLAGGRCQIDGFGCASCLGFYFVIYTFALWVPVRRMNVSKMLDVRTCGGIRMTGLLN